MNVCTITTRARFASACVLVDAVLLHHRRAASLVFVLDDREHELDAAGRPFELLRPGDLGLSRFETLAGIHPEHELREVVKPAVLRLALERFETVCYLDPSTHVYAQLSGLESPAPAVLVPRALRPIPADGRRPSDADICRLGAYDSGCLAFSRDRLVDEMLCSWSERLETAPQEEHPMIRAHWLDLLPGQLPGTRLLRDPGVGLAAWNLHERRLEQREQEWCVGDERVPLRLANFAGLNAEIGDWRALVAGVNARVLPEAFEDLFEQREQLAQLASGPRQQRGYGYDRLADGTPLNARLREAIRDAERLGKLRSSPFSTTGTRDLLDWLNEPAGLGARAGVSRFWLEIYAERPDLQLIHADLDGGGGGGFMTWIAEFGRDAYDVPTSLMPPGLRS